MDHSKPLLFAALFIVNTGALADLEEVIVTAQKRSQKIENVAISVAVVPGSFLDDRNIATLEDLTANFPAIVVAKNSGATKLYMRGIGSQGNAGLDQAVATFVDEIYHGRSRTTKNALVDLERVEILRGPQTMFFGRNASAGALSVHTIVPDMSAKAGYLLSNMGSNGSLGGTLAYNIPLSKGLAVRAVANVQSDEGYWDMVDAQSGAKTGTGGGIDSRLFRVSSLWQPRENLSLHVKLETQDLERTNPFAWQPRGCGNLYGLGMSTQDELDVFWRNTGSMDPNPLALPFSCSSDFVDNEFDSRSPASPHNTSSFESDEAVLRMDWQLGSATLTSITGYFDMDFTVDGNDLSHGSAVTRTFWSRDDSRQTSEELRLTSDGDASIDWMLGVYFHSGSADYQSGDADGRSPQRPQYAYSRASQDEDMASVFAALTWHATEHFEASIGLRWARTEKTFSGRDSVIRATGLPTTQREAFESQVNSDVSGSPSAYAGFDRQIRNEFISESRSFSDTLPSVKLLYNNSNAMSLYYKWSKGMKSGGFNFRLNGLDGDDLTYESETVSAHEVGYKGTFIDNRLRVALAVFSSKYTDLQQNSSRGDDGGIAAAVIRNVTEATSEGVELDANWQLTQGLRLDLSVGWLDARFDDYRGADCTRLQSVVSRTDVASEFSAHRAGNRCFQDLGGARTPFAPEFTSRAGLSHTIALSTSLDITTSVDWLYSDEFFTSPHADPLRQQDAYHKFNARLEIGDRNNRWLLALIARNLGDELTSRQLGQDDDAAVSGLVDPPRQLFLQARFGF